MAQLQSHKIFACKFLQRLVSNRLINSHIKRKSKSISEKAFAAILKVLLQLNFMRFYSFSHLPWQ